MDSNPCGHLSLILRIAPSVLDKCSPPVNIFALDYAFNKTCVRIYISVEWSLLTGLLNFHVHLSVVDKSYLIFSND